MPEYFGNFLCQKYQNNIVYFEKLWNDVMSYYEYNRLKVSTMVNANVLNLYIINMHMLTFYIFLKVFVNRFHSIWSHSTLNKMNGKTSGKKTSNQDELKSDVEIFTKQTKWPIWKKKTYVDQEKKWIRITIKLWIAHRYLHNIFFSIFHNYQLPVTFFSIHSHNNNNNLNGCTVNKEN